MMNVTDEIPDPSGSFRGEELAFYYSNYRPHYPDNHYTDIIGLLDKSSGEETRHKRAVDVGCGSGQTTIPLAKYFQEVIGVDSSEAQINEAKKWAQNLPNIKYRVGVAEQLSFLADESVDLITVGTALHWFDVDKFCQECVRVLRPRGVVVAYSYELGEFTRLGTEQDNVRECMDFYRNIAIRYGQPQLDYLMNRYAMFLPTFQKHFSGARRYEKFSGISRKFSVEGLKGFIKSMSFYWQFMQTLQPGAPDPLNDCIDRLSACYGGNPPKDAVIFESDVALLIGRKIKS